MASEGLPAKVGVLSPLNQVGGDVAVLAGLTILIGAEAGAATGDLDQVLREPIKADDGVFEVGGIPRLCCDTAELVLLERVGAIRRDQDEVFVEIGVEALNILLSIKVRPVGRLDLGKSRLISVSVDKGGQHKRGEKHLKIPQVGRSRGLELFGFCPISFHLVEAMMFERTA